MHRWIGCLLVQSQSFVDTIVSGRKVCCTATRVMDYVHHCLLQMEAWAMSVDRRSTELTRTNRALRAASEQTKKVKGCRDTIVQSIKFDDVQRVRFKSGFGKT